MNPSSGIVFFLFFVQNLKRYMLLLISPAKTLDMSPEREVTTTKPRLLDDSQALIKTLRDLNSTDLQDLMGVSENIAALNVTRFKQFKLPFNAKNAKPAVMAFKGDVYEGLNVANFEAEDLAYTQDNLRILSGLYGLLRPLDLMQAYRLEMGTTLKNERGSNLYQFWGDKITDLLNTDISKGKHKLVLNLASQEYAKAIQPKRVKVPVYSANFKEYKGAELKIISFNAKRARGLMSRFVLKNRLSTIEDIKSFKEENYLFSPEHSTERDLVFIR